MKAPCLLCCLMLALRLSSAPYQQVNEAPKQERWPCGGNASLLVDASGSAVRISSNELRKRAIQSPAPVLPSSLRAAGTIRVDVLVDGSGEIACIRAEEGHPLLRQAVTAVLHKWKFKPLSAGGHPVAVQGRLEFRFH